MAENYDMVGAAILIDDLQITELAQQIHLERSSAEQGRHQQSPVPWNELGETFKVSLLRMAKEKLTQA